MHTLTFDVEAEKSQLTQIFIDRIATQGSIFNVLNVNINDVLFDDVTKKIHNQDKLLSDMKNDLIIAKKDGENWFNETQPQLTFVPQAAINFASQWNASISTILSIVRQSSPNRSELAAIFGGFKDKIDEQLLTLTSLMSHLVAAKTDLSADANNFSNKHLSFKQLEEIDKENLAAVRIKLNQVKAMVAQYNCRIDVDTIKANKELAIASNAMKYGKKLGNPGKVVGLTIGLIFIVSAVETIDDLLATVDNRFNEEQKEGKYEMDMSFLSAQLLALETASSALAGFVTQVEDMISSLQKTIDGWQRESAVMVAIIADLNGVTPVNEIINEFDLGKTAQQWDEISIFAAKWQHAEVSPAGHNDLVLGGSTS
ncbi:HBL/NHE enterotoxin family protein [Shewanella psychropiezotolerans]|uniref:HBL/NHE enterotoxin family protein n=1 Tax=Shewanella psychropiezotolerans TaxID=2593655 RepID=A0ABX5WTM7_9GAMM|nr:MULTISPECIES: HBL/NHE enterotoxin family protein [Shewanella]MPY24512.1 HBL/NHE enterotoxin family protein [Shewanella sp. YLB-07]QDO82452.1 HBL/NHE enterotoxin family protein [Shewanella psychropiezotolerans]